MFYVQLKNYIPINSLLCHCDSTALPSPADISEREKALTNSMVAAAISSLPNQTNRNQPNNHVSELATPALHRNKKTSVLNKVKNVHSRYFSVLLAFLGLYQLC